MLKAIICLFGIATIAACALDPVESNPAEADRRVSAMRQDCYARGGTWSEPSRTCVGADARR
jgi:hypothetical protein